MLYRRDDRRHWSDVYGARAVDEVSWYQAEADLSARLIQEIAPDRSVSLIDVGGGASVLVAQLEAAGYNGLTVLDLSSTAIAAAQNALGNRAGKVRWIQADVLEAPLRAAGYGVWHDRAVFHFLTEPAARAQYVAQVHHAVAPGGYVLVATFAQDGPTRCSGLDVMRYSPEQLHAEFGMGFLFVKAEREEHWTPRGTMQAFTYCLCQRVPAG